MQGFQFQPLSVGHSMLYLARSTTGFEHFKAPSSGSEKEVEVAAKGEKFSVGGGHNIRRFGLDRFWIPYRPNERGDVISCTSIHIGS